MKTLYSLISIFSMTLIASNSYSQCGPSTPVTCTPTTSDLTTDFGLGVFGLTLSGTTYTSDGAYQDGGYRSNPCDLFSIEADRLTDITVTTGAAYEEKVNVYIDYNGDGDFADSGELIFTSSSGIGDHTGTFRTPTGPIGQELWVRVISDYFTQPDYGPCGQPDYGQVEDFAVILTAPPCGPSTIVTCQPSSSLLDPANGMGVLGLQIGSTSYTSDDAYTDGGFRSNPCNEFSLDGGTNYSIDVTTGSIYDEKVRVYIDYNNDGDFVDSGELIFSSDSGIGSHSGSFTTPIFSSVDVLWIRVVSDYYTGTPTITPCSSPDYGQAEDFVIRTNPIAPTSNFTASSVSECLGTTINFTDLSTGGPTSWEWTISGPVGGVYIYSDQNPSHLFDVADTYTVFLKVTNVNGTNTLTKTNYITINDCSTIPTTYLQDKYCGTTPSSMSDALYLEKVEGATQYEWQLTSLSDASVLSLVRDRPLARLNMFSGILYNTSYTVIARSNVGGVWSDWGSSCIITTPNYPTIALKSKYCGISLSSMTSSFYCEKADLATDYWWEFINLSNANITVTIKGKATLIMNPTEAGLSPSTNYSVRIRPYIEGAWRDLGTNCVITTPAAAIVNYSDIQNAIEGESINMETLNMDNQLAQSINEFSIYPNPANKGENIFINTKNIPNGDYSVVIMDMYGKMIFNNTYSVLNNIFNENLTIQPEISSGIYIVSIKGFSYTRNERIIIK